MSWLRAMLSFFVAFLLYIDTCALAYEERSQRSQKRFMTPHERMAKRRYHQKTTKQKQEESISKYKMKQERMRAESDIDSSSIKELLAEDDSDRNKAPDESISGVVTELNASVLHEPGLEKEATKRRHAEKKLHKEVGEIERKETLALLAAVLAFVTVATVALLRWCRRTR